MSEDEKKIRANNRLAKVIVKGFTSKQIEAAYKMIQKKKSRKKQPSTELQDMARKVMKKAAAKYKKAQKSNDPDVRIKPSKEEWKKFVDEEWDEMRSSEKWLKAGGTPVKKKK